MNKMRERKNVVKRIVLRGDVDKQRVYLLQNEPNLPYIRTRNRSCLVWR